MDMLKKTGLILFSLLFLFSSCITTIPSDDVEYFAMGSGTMQYFFPSRPWDAMDSELMLEGDWLYRNYILDEETEARSIFNFSIYSDEVTVNKEPSRILLTINDRSIEIPEEHVTIVYVDQKKTRFTSWLTSDEMKYLIGDEGEIMELELFWNHSYRFQNSKDFLPHLEYFREVVIGRGIEL